ncbi:MAG: hypothetical protein HZC28_14205 [Spirochaetes bacterium]|nr:hypothetical protein [Spirochaetota bacterium]
MKIKISLFLVTFVFLSLLLYPASNENYRETRKSVILFSSGISYAYSLSKYISVGTFFGIVSGGASWMGNETNYEISVGIPLRINYYFCDWNNASFLLSPVYSLSYDIINTKYNQHTFSHGLGIEVGYEFREVLCFRIGFGPALYYFKNYLSDKYEFSFGIVGSLGIGFSY